MFATSAVPVNDSVNLFFFYFTLTFFFLLREKHLLHAHMTVIMNQFISHFAN